jgi:hypothetical protein
VFSHRAALTLVSTRHKPLFLSSGFSFADLPCQESVYEGKEEFSERLAGVGGRRTEGGIHI